MATFAPKPGCPLCGIVASAAAQSERDIPPVFSPTSTQPQAEILWRDTNFTAYREKVNPVSSKGHVIIAFNLHVPSIYTLSSTDLPLLVNVRSLAHRLLSSLQAPPPSPALTPSVQTFPSTTPLQNNNQFRVGFITPPFRDNKIPVTDHLHAHAYIEPADLMGWWRGVSYGPLAWYAIDDLIAEIRESFSNNRVKSGYENRSGAPIDMVPSAGARTGTADGVETSEPGIANADMYEDGLASPSTSSTRSPTLVSPQGSTASLPSIRV
ncbi:hypothetical protein AMATHDRAFT_148170 [Amanita thiersii Skay4041]|uniref:HIT domain-containing protein n=1 Tax=Amanita thiersii Skay4041 TaxID=703135 RepID=A0A2A9NLL4_9AGAR|nr:hypothetical protein AMATHDRAFT_148170 [Amanita thiersii Skay4041]